jgi:hypothetical protein
LVLRQLARATQANRGASTGAGYVTRSCQRPGSRRQ